MRLYFILLISFGVFFSFGQKSEMERGRGPAIYEHRQEDFKAGQ